MNAAAQFLDDAGLLAQVPDPVFKIGRIDPTWDGLLRPPVIFDADGSATTRTFPYLSSYVPVAGDYVLLARVGHGWVILGRVVYE